VSVGAAPPAPASPLHRLRLPPGLDRRLVVGGAGVLLLLVLLAVSGLGPPLGSSTPVELNFEHPLRSGVLKVFVDDDLVLEETLESWVKEDLLVMKVRKGRVTKSFDVPAGDRVLRLEVEGDGYRGTRTLEARFEAGEARRLEARLGGLVKKDLSAWLAPRKESAGSIP
jgi:hypothetical protein